MKKFLLFVLAFLPLCVTRVQAASDFQETASEVATCEAILQEFMADKNYAIPPEVWQRAKAVVIVNQFKAGFLFGVKAGWGVILAKKADGSWSVPVLLKAGEMSLGLQVGGSKEEAIFVITNEETVRKLYSARLNVGVDAKAVAGPRFREVETVNREILDAPVLVYTRSKGLFAGATVKAGYLSRDDDKNRRFYNTIYTLPELLYGDFVQPIPEVVPLMNLVKSYAP